MKISTISVSRIVQPCRLEGIDYQIDPYEGCEHYCYYCYALNDAKFNWKEEIRIHNDIVGRLCKELENIPPQKIYLGYYTDPYQPAEADLRQTRQILEALSSKGFSASILTKSNLVLRDIDLLKTMPNSSVSVSVAFENEDTRRLFEANTIDTELRISALREIKQAGIGTSSLLCPVIPYITDVEALIDKLLPYADRIWVYGLSVLSPTDTNWLNLKEILKLNFPDVFENIEEVVFSKKHEFWERLRLELERIRAEGQYNIKIRL